MTPEQQDLLVKARDSVAAARMLVRGGFPDFAVSRAYYAMFYVAQALLEGEGLAFSKHSATIAAFGRHLVRSGKVSADYHRILIDAQDLRQTGDYGLPNSITPAQADEQLVYAERFLTLAEQHLGPIP